MSDAAGEDRRSQKALQREERRARRARRKAERRAAMPRIEEIIPPEGAPLRFQIAGLGARFGAQITDLLICIAAMAAILITLGVGLDAPGSALEALAALLFFAIRAPYYAAAELFWNGRTLGKKLTGLRVISADGRALTPHAVVARNLMKEVEVFVPGTMLVAASDFDAFAAVALLVWIAVLLAVPLRSKRSQRLGDMIAGTVVIVSPVTRLLPDLTAAPTPQAAQDRFVFRPDQLDHYGAYELQTLEKVLQSLSPPVRTAAEIARRAATLEDISQRIRAKITYEDIVPEAEAEAFLRAFYATQRAYLEQRQIFGDRRADKRHAMKEGAGPGA